MAQGFIPYKLLNPKRLPVAARTSRPGHPQEGYKELLGKALKFKITQVRRTGDEPWSARRGGSVSFPYTQEAGLDGSGVRRLGGGHIPPGRAGRCLSLACTSGSRVPGPALLCNAAHCSLHPHLRPRLCPL